MTLFILGCGQGNQVYHEKPDNLKENQVAYKSAKQAFSNSTIDGSIIPTASMETARAAHTSTLLNDGKVLICGGFSGSTLASAEIYNPNSKIFKSVGNMTVSRAGHSATLLPDEKFS